MLYVTYCDLNDAGYLGIKKKIMAQISAFKENFGRVYFAYCAWQMAYLMDGEKIVEKEAAVTRKEYNQILCRWIERYHFERTYIRYPFANQWFIQFLKFQKERQIKSVLEIPTYPYDGELGYGRIKVEDSCFREQIYGYMDCIATYSYDKEIWGIPCIILKNGIELRSFPVNTKKKEEKKIVLIAVSSMAFWHGYERILEGMYRYYKEGGTYKFYLKFIGEGPEEYYYRNLTEKYGLQSLVKFYGKMTGTELDKQFALSDIAVGSLGTYKAGVLDASPIKGAEYCARGIPFICGYRDMRFPEKQEFILNVSSDAEPIHMNEVIDFHERVTSRKSYQEVMRDYAEKYLTWKSILKPVTDYLGG